MLCENFHERLYGSVMKRGKRVKSFTSDEARDEASGRAGARGIAPLVKFFTKLARNRRNPIEIVKTPLDKTIKRAYIEKKLKKEV